MWLFSVLTEIKKLHKLRFCVGIIGSRFSLAYSSIAYYDVTVEHNVYQKACVAYSTCNVVFIEANEV